MSAAAFRVDRTLVESARAVLAASRPAFVLGGAGTGKSTVCAALAAARGLTVIDMDARLYGRWHDAFEPARHPVGHAWATAGDPLGWQLRLGVDGYLAFQAALAAEALDLLAAELATHEASSDAPRGVLVDGGFGSVAVVADAVPPDRIVCLALPAEDRARVWTEDPARRPMLEWVAAVDGLDEPVARFLALDAALTEAMAREARGVGAPVLERRPGLDAQALSDQVAGALGLG